MNTETLTLETADGPMKAYWAEPEHRSGRAVVVIQEAFGVNHHIEDVCRRFADAGFAAMAPHVFHRAGDPVIDYNDLPAAMPVMGTLTKEGLSADIEAANAELRTRGFAPTATGIVGFCMGGTVAFFADATYNFGAAVSFYGGGIEEGRFGGPSLLELAPSLRGPWLGFFGDQDTGIPVEQVEKLRAATDPIGAQTQVVRYPDAGHGFHCDARPAAYNEEAAKDAWSRTIEWFDQHLQPS